MPLTPDMITHIRHWSRNMAWLVWIARKAAERWRFRGTADGWSPNANATLTTTPNGLILNEVVADANISITGLAIDGATHRYVILDLERVAFGSVGTWQGVLRYATSGHGFSLSFYKVIENIGLGERRLQVLDMHALTVGGTDWQTNEITQLRVDLDDDAGGQFVIHGIHVGEADLYLWSGSYHLTHWGRTWYGYGYLTQIESIRRREGIEHVEQVFEFNGLDPSIIADLDTSVRGRPLSIWLGGLDNDRQIVRDPLLLSDSIIQDSLGWTYSLDQSTVKLRLTGHDGLPALGRIKGTKWSNESQLAEYSGDVGFKYNAPIALQGPAVTWSQP